MSEFGKPIGEGIDVRYHGDETQFDPVSYTDDLIEIVEKPEFNEHLLVEEDLILIRKPIFQDKIVSTAYNYVQDYFELRAQRGQDGAATSEYVEYVEKAEYAPVPSVITFTRVDGKVTEINNINIYGTKTTIFTRVNGKVTRIDIDNYGTTQRRIDFTRVLDKVTQIDIS